MKELHGIEHTYTGGQDTVHLVCSSPEGYVHSNIFMIKERVYGGISEARSYNGHLHEIAHEHFKNSSGEEGYIEYMLETILDRDTEVP